VVVFLVFEPAVRLLGSNGEVLATYALAVALPCVVGAFILIARRYARDDLSRLLLLGALWFSAVPLLYVIAQRMVDAWQLFFLSLALFLFTGSLLLPLKAALMNVLTLSAALGILVLIFQDGRFESLLGYTSQGGLEAPQLLLLFAVVFGLSTDYGVFLLSRIKEARDGGYSDSEAVAVGLERTGRIVTAAALLFAVAFGAFLTSKIIITKELGLATAAAVLIDATIIRALLVPALMQLLGEWNWWAPAPLRRLRARIRLSET
jgi:RND superfamily putative drug exporter